MGTNSNNRIYVVVQNIRGKAPSIDELYSNRLLFFAEEDCQSDTQQGWVVSELDATRLTLQEAEAIIGKCGGIPLHLETYREHLAEMQCL